MTKPNNGAVMPTTPVPCGDWPFADAIGTATVRERLNHHPGSLRRNVMSRADRLAASSRSRFRWRSCLAAVVVWVAVASPVVAQNSATVGMPGRLEAVVLSGSELEVKPLTDRTAPVVLRVAAVYPHGSAFRYDLEYTGFVPGTHDLRLLLRRKDGTMLGELPPLTATVTPVLPPGQIEPHALVIDRGPAIGGYRQWVIVGVVVWVLVLLAVVASFVFPRRRHAAIDGVAPVSLADRLRPLVEGAVAGKLSQAELAGLERGLLAYWRKRLKVEAADPGTAIDALRRHPDAGPLLNQLEGWLHRPDAGPPADVTALLAPYRSLPPDAVELPTPEGKA